jgi:phage/plasmid-associated DNA primase
VAQITGGDAICVQAKYQTGITRPFYSKLVFMMNDSPTFSDADAFAIKRRIMNLPMRAQRLALDNDDERTKLSSEGKAHYIFDKDPDLLDKLKKHHIPAYQRWCVQGATQYYKNGMSLSIPVTVGVTSPLNVDVFLDSFTTFVKDSLVSGGDADRISSVEIMEVFLRREGRNDVDKKVTNALFKLLKSKLVGKEGEFRLPARNKVIKTQKGYNHIAWREGPLASIINDIRRENMKETRPPISDAPLDAEAEAEDADI